MLVDAVNPHNNMPDPSNVLENQANLGLIRSRGWRFCSDVQEIIPGLYLGSQSAHELLPVDALLHFGIRYLVEVRQHSDVMYSTRPQSNPSHFNYLGINMIDCETENILALLPKTISFIEEALWKQAKVLVCSNRGNSRSASFVLAYIMQKNQTNLSEALNFVRTKRPSVNPNAGFRAQLNEYEPIYKARRCFALGGSSSRGVLRAKRKLEEFSENDANLYNCPKSLKGKTDADSSSMFLKIR